jgi:Putative Ig domain
VSGRTLNLAAHVTTGCTPDNSLSGSLPPGMRFDSRSGRISGTPTAGGIYTVTVQPDVASSLVSDSVTLTIQPVGRQTAEMSPTLLPTPANTPTRDGGSVAATTYAGKTRLWIASYAAAPDHQQYELLRSDNDGQDWVTDTAGGLMQPRGDTLGSFLVAALGGRAYALEAGGSLGFQPVGNVLYLFNGTSWSVRSDTLPFYAPRGSQLQALADGTLVASWGEADGVVIWTSADEGLHWTNRSASGGLSSDSLGDLPACVGKIGDEWHAVGQGPSWEHASMAPGTFLWGTQQSWPWFSHMEPLPVCASDGTNLWIIGRPSDGGYSPPSVSDVLAGESAFAYPRRLPTMSNVDLIVSMAASNGHLYALEGGSGRYRLWKLR